MTFKYGNTRWVFVFDNYVIKVARIRPLLAIKCIVKHLFERTEKDPLYRNKTVLRIFLGITLNGISANLAEYYYSKGHPNDTRIFHTILCVLGLITVQHRGNEIICFQKWIEYWKSSPNLIGGDLENIKQFGIDKNGQIRILDYGFRADCYLLSKSL